MFLSVCYGGLMPVTPNRPAHWQINMSGADQAWAGEHNAAASIGFAQEVDHGTTLLLYVIAALLTGLQHADKHLSASLKAWHARWPRQALLV
jgi:hypothetical protein